MRKALLKRDAKRGIAVAHVTPADGNVFADLGFSPEEAGTLHVRSQLLSEVVDIYRRRKLARPAAAKLFGISQSRLSQALQGRIGEFSIDALVSMLSHAGRRVDVSIRPARKAA